MQTQFVNALKNMPQQRVDAGQILLAIIVVSFIPAFLYRKFGKRITSFVMFVNGFVMAVAAVFAEPLILAVNPLLALIAVLIPQKS